MTLRFKIIASILVLLTTYCLYHASTHETQGSIEQDRSFDYCGYITNIDNVDVLVVADPEYIDKEINQIPATIIKVFKSNPYYSLLQIGIKVM